MLVVLLINQKDYELFIIEGWKKQKTERRAQKTVA